MRKRFLALAALVAGLWALAIPAGADININDVSVTYRGVEANIRVIVSNPGTTRQDGPIVIRLFARQCPDCEWQLLQTWNDIPFLQPGYRVARDYFSSYHGTNAQLLPYLRHRSFQVKAVVNISGGPDAVKIVDVNI